MKIFLPVRRATILIPSGPAHDLDRLHLFIILNDPVSLDDKGEVLLVPCSSVPQNRYYDNACVLPACCHPFITKESFIDYRWSRITKVTPLMEGVRDGSLVAKGPLDEEHFRKIYEGLFHSRHISPKAKTFLEQLRDAE